MRNAGMAEMYVRIIQDMCDDSRPTTAVGCAVGVTEGFEVSEKNGQGPGMSKFLTSSQGSKLTLVR